jgi:hypothetical protein
MFCYVNHHDGANNIVDNAVRDNTVASFILKYLEEIDQDIEEPCVMTLRVFGRMGRYWLDGSSSMTYECYSDLCRILRLELSAEDQQIANHMNMQDVGATRFFQSNVNGIVPPSVPGAHGMIGYPQPIPQNPTSLSFAQMHPELGLSMAEYGELMNKSMLKGSVGIYLKVATSITLGPVCPHQPSERVQPEDGRSCH